LSQSLLDSLLNIALAYRERADLGIIQPRVNWRQSKNSLAKANGAAPQLISAHDLR
jgi:hypothetical protein